MFGRAKMSIRFKILVATLFVITGVVSTITFTMASLFNADKKNYVTDVSALVAGHVAEEVNAYLRECQARLASYARVLDDPELGEPTRTDVLREMATDFPDVVMLTAFEADSAVGTVYDPDAIDAAKLEPAAITAEVLRQRPGVEQLRKEGVYVANSTLNPAMPTFTMVLASPRPDSLAPRTVAAVIQLDRLLELADQSQAFTVSLVGSDGVLLASHDRAAVAARHRRAAQTLTARGAMAEASTYRTEGGEVIGGRAGTRVGGVTAIAEVPVTSAYFASRELLGRLTAVSLGLLCLAALAAIIGSRSLTSSIRKLADVTREIGQGRFDVQVDVRSRDEIGSLAESFNRMTSELNARETQLQQAQAQLIQSEKMAAFGQLGAGFAHEIKNPLAGILGLVQINLRHAQAGTPLRVALETMEKETKRCKTIIDNLLKFARQEKVAYERVDLHKVIEDSGAIMRHQLGLHQVELTVEAPKDLPHITGNANQIQQVLMNLVLNAQQAMTGPGHVWVSASCQKPGRVEIRVRDDGPGIPKDIQTRIFEPFFTTKPAGEGTGLGLSVTFGIVKDHQGGISVLSEPGYGTMFLIDLPVDNPAAIPQGPVTTGGKVVVRGATAPSAPADTERKAA